MSSSNHSIRKRHTRKCNVELLEHRAMLTAIFAEGDAAFDSFWGGVVDLGDLDGDGDLDAFFANQSEKPDRVFLNDGTGVFAATPTSLGQLSSSGGVRLGDLDGDGDIDAFVAATPESVVWLNDGSGDFSDSTNRLNDGFSTDVEMGDVDGDGDLGCGHDKSQFPGARMVQ